MPRISLTHGVGDYGGAVVMVGLSVAMGSGVSEGALLVGGLTIFLHAVLSDSEVGVFPVFGWLSHLVFDLVVGASFVVAGLRAVSVLDGGASIESSEALAVVQRGALLCAVGVGIFVLSSVTLLLPQKRKHPTSKTLRATLPLARFERAHQEAEPSNHAVSRPSVIRCAYTGSDQSTQTQIEPLC